MQTSSLTGTNILILDDEVLLRKQLTAQLERLGADVMGAGTVKVAKQLLNDFSFDIALIDVNLPDGLGTDLLREKVFTSNTGVVVMTAEGGVSGAVEAMRLGALDYLTKPFDSAEIPLVLARVRRARQAARLDEHRRQGAPDFFFGKALADMQHQLGKILAADERLQSNLPPVLIQGETGTGKTTIARWLHEQGPRHAQPMVETNCSALPEQLAESELFGHERGAFTDARSARIGLFEAASDGTLFLDELASLSTALQAKVLTAIEDGKIRRVGSNKMISVDVRIIAASNCDLKALVAAGKFREDLYHRLDLFRLQIPPLRTRGEDILKLAETLKAQICKRHRLPIRGISDLGIQRLLRYHWPGNVRELAHELERALVFEDRATLDFPHLGLDTAAQPATFDQKPPNDWFNERYEFQEHDFNLEEAINRLIQHALQQTDQNVSAAARLLGVSRDYIRYRLENSKPKTGE